LDFDDDVGVILDLRHGSIFDDDFEWVFEDGSSHSGRHVGQRVFEAVNGRNPREGLINGFRLWGSRLSRVPFGGCKQ